MHDWEVPDAMCPSYDSLPTACRGKERTSLMPATTTSGTPQAAPETLPIRNGNESEAISTDFESLMNIYPVLPLPEYLPGVNPFDLMPQTSSAKAAEQMRLMQAAEKLGEDATEKLDLMEKARKLAEETIKKMDVVEKDKKLEEESTVANDQVEVITLEEEEEEEDIVDLVSDDDEDVQLLPMDSKLHKEKQSDLDAIKDIDDYHRQIMRAERQYPRDGKQLLHRLPINSHKELEEFFRPHHFDTFNYFYNMGRLFQDISYYFEKCKTKDRSKVSCLLKFIMSLEMLSEYRMGHLGITQKTYKLSKQRPLPAGLQQFLLYFGRRLYGQGTEENATYNKNLRQFFKGKALLKPQTGKNSPFRKIRLMREGMREGAIAVVDLNNNGNINVDNGNGNSNNSKGKGKGKGKKSKEAPQAPPAPATSSTPPSAAAQSTPPSAPTPTASPFASTTTPVSPRTPTAPPTQGTPPSSAANIPKSYGLDSFLRQLDDGLPPLEVKVKREPESPDTERPKSSQIPTTFQKPGVEKPEPSALATAAAIVGRKWQEENEKVMSKKLTDQKKEKLIKKKMAMVPTSVAAAQLKKDYMNRIQMKEIDKIVKIEEARLKKEQKRLADEEKRLAKENKKLAKENEKRMKEELKKSKQDSKRKTSPPKEGWTKKSKQDEKKKGDPDKKDEEKKNEEKKGDPDNKDEEKEP